jgi:hypothetical protein
MSSSYGPFFFGYNTMWIASAGSYCRVQMNESKVYLFFFWWEMNSEEENYTNGWIQEKGGGACDICSIFTNKKKGATELCFFFCCLRSNSRCPLNFIFDYAVGDLFPFYYYCQRGVHLLSISCEHTCKYVHTPGLFNCRFFVFVLMGRRAASEANAEIGVIPGRVAMSHSYYICAVATTQYIVAMQAQ